MSRLGPTLSWLTDAGLTVGSIVEMQTCAVTKSVQTRYWLCRVGD